MYIPPTFQFDDPEKLSAFMNAFSFATLVTSDSNTPFASHLPVRHVRDSAGSVTLVSHMARANPQWKHFASQSEVLTIFTGPHAYISPSWYTTTLTVPTWNYAAVHVYGRPRIVDNHSQVVQLLADTIHFYEQSLERSWSGILPEEFRDQLINSIVAFEIQVTRMEGKLKLGQNRSTADKAGVYAALANANDDSSRSLAELMVSEGMLGEQTG